MAQKVYLCKRQFLGDFDCLRVVSAASRGTVGKFLADSGSGLGSDECRGLNTALAHNGFA